MAASDGNAGSNLQPTRKAVRQKTAPEPARENTLLPCGAIPLTITTGIERVKDPLGVLPDHVSTDPGDDSLDAQIALLQTIEANTPHARVKRLQGHPHEGIKEHADALHARLMAEIGSPLAGGLNLPLGVHQINGDDIPELMAAIAEAETAALRLSLEPIVMRDMQAQHERAKGGLKKRDNDPKYAAKIEALTLWLEHRAGKHPKLRTVEQYAIEVMRRWPVLRSAKVIAGWSAKWTADVRAGRTPAC